MVVKDASLTKILVKPEKIPFNRIKVRPWRGLSIWRDPTPGKTRVRPLSWQT